MDRGEFIDEIRVKLPSFIRERIAAWQRKYAEEQAAFYERLVPASENLDKIQVAYAVYLNEGLPRDVNRNVKKEKQRAIRSFLGVVIGVVIGVFISFKWITPEFSLETTLWIILPIIAVLVYFFCKSAVKFLHARRDIKSQKFADELAREWRANNGIDEVVSNIEAEQDKWKSFSESLKRCIHSAECALVGSDEELLDYYNHDKKAKNWYLENIYEGEW
jgi:hypothetical protein